MNRDKATCVFAHTRRCWLVIIGIAWMLTPLGWNLAETRAFFTYSKCCGNKQTDCAGCVDGGNGTRWVSLPASNNYFVCGNTTDNTLACTNASSACFGPELLQAYSNNTCTAPIHGLFINFQKIVDQCKVPPNDACPPSGGVTGD
jgi:hypothetical protein